MLRGYAAVLFCRHELVGLVLLGVTFVEPATGAMGLLAALVARSVAFALGAASAESPSEVCNALLVGLGLGAAFAPSPELALLVAFSGLLTALATPVVGGWLWRLNRLPALSAPFVLLGWLVALAAHSASGLEPAARTIHPALSPPWFDAFFTSLGWFLFTPHPLAGVAMFAALLLTSRYLALLAVAGYAAGILVLCGFGVPAQAELIGFNFMLAAMAVGGLFALPDRASFAFALVAAVLAALTAAAMAGPLGLLGLPPLAAPFLIATWLVLAGLAVRPPGRAPFLLLEHPTLPERSLLAARLARARLAEPDSYAVQPPFFGAWRVSQGIDGPHTHRGPWRNAFDFVVTDQDGRSHRGEGRDLEDYHAFGAPALAPVAGQVWRCEAGLPDNPPGEFEARPGRNFGNHVLIRTADGLFVLVAHLRQGSVSVKPGDWIEAGASIGACGNSGRSAQPHLHLQVQASDELGAPTRPLHLRSVVVQGSGEENGLFVLSARPEAGDMVSTAAADPGVARCLRLPAGRRLSFVDAQGRRNSLRVELTLLGQCRLAGKGDASSVFEERPDVLAFYNRRGGGDALLDAWLLALGFTPLAGAARQWSDAPPVSLAPLSLLQRTLVGVLRPFGASFDSRYERRIDGKGWRQTGRHVLRLLPGMTIEVTTEAAIDAALGCRVLSVVNGARARSFTLVETGVAGDVGIAERRLSVVSEPARKAA
jgi:urea transporter